MSAPRASEFELIARYFAPIAPPSAFGLRDDAAVLTPEPGHDLVISKDMLVAGRHFFADDPPDLIAGKALRVNLSDLAAKGARPVGFMLGLALPPDWRPDWLDAFASGLAAESRRFSVPLFGGDTVRAIDALTVSITIFGTLPCGTMVRRTASRAGDRLYVSGCIGDAALGLHLLQEPALPANLALAPELRRQLIGRYHTPQPRMALAEGLRRYARAGMDISDGFVGDLEKFLAGAGVSAILPSASIPLSPAARQLIGVAPELFETALTGGDDYELLIAVPPQHEASLRDEASSIGVPLTLLATLQGQSATPLSITDGSGRPLVFKSGSFTHF